MMRTKAGYVRSMRHSLALALGGLALTLPASGDIFQWEWVDPSNHSMGKQQSTVLCVNGAGAYVGSYAQLASRNLSMAYLSNALLYGANLNSATLVNAELDAVLWYANLTKANLTGANL